MRLQFPLTLSTSDWEYETASSGGLTVMFAAASGGMLTLKDPTGALHQYRYGSAGVGAGARLPRYGKVNLQVRGKSVGAAGATEDFYARGKVLVADSIAARGLNREDFKGACVFIEGGAGADRRRQLLGHAVRSGHQASGHDCGHGDSGGPTAPSARHHRAPAALGQGCDPHRRRERGVAGWGRWDIYLGRAVLSGDPA